MAGKIRSCETSERGRCVQKYVWYVDSRKRKCGIPTRIYLDMAYESDQVAISREDALINQQNGKYILKIYSTYCGEDEPSHSFLLQLASCWLHIMPLQYLTIVLTPAVPQLSLQADHSPQTVNENNIVYIMATGQLSCANA